MSRVRRAAAKEPQPSPPLQRRLFTDGDGGVRTSWLLTVSLLAWAGLTVVLRYGLMRAFAALFAAWGLDAATAPLAPGWARAVYSWHGSLVSVAFAAGALGVCHWLRRLWQGRGDGLRFRGDALVRWTLAGAGCALFVAALCLIPDSMRLSWPLSSPRVSLSVLPILVISLLSALAEEAFVKRVLYDGLDRRWRKPWPAAFVCAAFFVIDRGYAASWPGAVNVLLLGLATLLIYRRRGLWASAGFRWGWSVFVMFLMGFGGEVSVYRFYSVSEGVLTGGDAGPIYGLWTTLALSGLVAWMLMARTQKQTG